MSGASWFNTGYNGVDAEKDRRARAVGPSRYWMKEQTTREIVFVDDEPFCIDEHSWKQNGSWRNYLTCNKMSDIRPCCEKLGDRSRSYTGFYTIIDCTSHTDAKGAVYQYEVKLLPAKLDTIGLIRRKKESRGSLVGALFKVTRDTSDNANVGNDYEFVKEVGLDKLLKVANYRNKKLPDLFKEAAEKPEAMALLRDTFALEMDGDKIVSRITPFNYTALLAPKDPKEVRAILGSYVPEGGPGGKSDDVVPF